MGHRVGGDIVLALQGVRVLGDGGQGLGRSVDDLKVINTLVTLNLLTLWAKNLESGKYSFVGNVIFFLRSRIVRAADARHKQRLEADGSSENVEVHKEQWTVLQGWLVIVSEE